MAKKTKKKRAAVRKKKTGAKKPKTALFASHTFKYSCQGHVCSVTPRTKHMSTGDVAYLTASGTDVTITFGPNGTPFTTGGNVITLLAGQPQAFVVDSRQNTFRYSIACTSCGGQVGIPPEMIVP